MNPFRSQCVFGKDAFMKNRIKKRVCSYLLVGAVVLEVVFGLSGCTVGDSVKKMAQVGKRTEDIKKTEGDSGAAAPQQEKDSRQVTEVDIAKLKAKLEIVRSNYNDQNDEAQQYMDMAKAASNIRTEERMQSEMLRCYEENTLLAAELKALVMGSLGADVPDSFASESAVDQTLTECGDYFTDAVKESVLSEIASDDVREILKNGISGALDTYRSGGNLQDTLESAVQSTMDGVLATIQELPQKYALTVLDQASGGLSGAAETLLQGGSFQDALEGIEGGVIGEIGDILEYDAYPDAFVQELSRSVNESSQEVADFLINESITSEDIGKMMYEYTQFGNSLDVLSDNGGAVDFDWKPYYDKMEMAFQQYVRNEMMIEMLEEKAEESGANMSEAAAELAKMQIPNVSEYDMSQEGTLQEQAKALEDKIAEYKAANEAFEQMKAVGSEMLMPMEKYREQVEQLDFDCDAIRNYSVQNFQASYDMEGSEWIQDYNRFNYAVGKLAKFIPGGLFFSFMAAGTIDNNDRYYKNMVQMGDAISDACKMCVMDAKAAVEKLSMRLYFLDDLVDASHDMEKQYQNQCILQKLYGDSDIQIGPSMDEAREQLYLLGMQLHFIYRLYRTVLTNGSEANAYEQQYGEILEVLSRTGGNDLSNEIPPQRMAKYLCPVMDAGMGMIRGLDDVPAMDGRDNGFFRLYPDQTGEDGYIVDYCYLNSDLAFLLGFMSIYYADGEPFYVGGRYLYDDIVLNPGEDTDGAVLLEEARWMAYLPKSTSNQNEFYEHGQRYLAAIGKME